MHVYTSHASVYVNLSHLSQDTVWVEFLTEYTRQGKWGTQKVSPMRITLYKQVHSLDEKPSAICSLLLRTWPSQRMSGLQQRTGVLPADR